MDRLAFWITLLCFICWGEGVLTMEYHLIPCLLSLLGPGVVLAARPQEPSGWFGPGPGPPPIEYQHAPWFTYPERVSNGTAMPGEGETPDFRIEEDAWLVYSQTFFKEYERPYRMSPHAKQTYRFGQYNKDGWGRKVLNEYNFGCYCTTVYKRLTVLAGCAVLTTRHILTTATSTELVLSKNRHRYHLENILGAWYDQNGETFNSSVYMAPSRIHYHPLHMRPQDVNVTHPTPFSHDLAVWAGTTNFMRSLFNTQSVLTCSRGGPHWWEHVSSTPRYDDLAVVCGFQFVKAARKNPMPWYKYCVQTKKTVIPCPKTEWGWYHCLSGDVWGKYGVESGAAWNRCLKNHYWIYDGLIGMNAFSLRLRSKEMTHYFTVINTHINLDFLHDSYNNYIQCEWLDSRFRNSRGSAPVAKWWVPDFNQPGIEYYRHSWLPWYKK